MLLLSSITCNITDSDHQPAKDSLSRGDLTGELPSELASLSMQLSDASCIHESTTSSLHNASLTQLPDQYE